MKSRVKVIIGIIIILVFIIILGYNLMSSKIEYVDFKTAVEKGTKCQVNGKQNKEKEAIFDTKTNTLIFYMKDNNNYEMKIIYDGPKPSNFDEAEALVVKGTAKEGAFYVEAGGILTKCPSKYEK